MSSKLARKLDYVRERAVNAYWMGKEGKFKQIVKGRIKKELRKYMSKGELLGKKGKKIVSIPLPSIDLPRFKYGSKKTGGVGQGEGENGQPVGRGEDEAGTLAQLKKLRGDLLDPNVSAHGGRIVKTTGDGVLVEFPSAVGIIL